jgi:hypothetical protein
MDDVWYYAEGDKLVGPLSLADLKAVLSRLSNAKSTLVWRDGFSSWVEAENVPDLASYVIKPPPLPTSPLSMPQQVTARFREIRKFNELFKKQRPLLWWSSILVWWFVTFPVLILVDIYLWQHDHTNWAIAAALWITLLILSHIPRIVYWWFFLAVAAIVTIALIAAHPLLGAVWCFVIGAGWFAYKYLQVVNERNRLLRERIARRSASEKPKGRLYDLEELLPPKEE